jgi:hypothetical protein
MNTRYKKLSITLTIILVLGIVACFVSWKLMRVSVDKVYANEMSHKQEELALDQEKNLQELLENVSPEITKIKSRVVEANGTVAFITNLESLAREIGASLTISSVVEKPATKEGENFEYLTLSLAVHGSWNQVYRLLEIIESLPYKTSISAVSFNQTVTTTEKDKSPQSRWDEKITLQVLKKK